MSGKHQGCIEELAGTLGTQGPEKIYRASGGC